MKNIEEKKIPFVLLISSLLYIIVSYVNGEKIITYKHNYDDIIKSSYIDHQIPIFTTILFGVSIYLVLFKTDLEIKEFFSKMKDKIKLYFSKIPTISLLKQASKDNNKPTFESINVVNKEVELIEDTQERSDYLMIHRMKSNALSKGILFFFLFLIELAIVSSKPVLVFYLIILCLVIIQKFYGAYLCADLSKFNKGYSWVWFLFGLIFTSGAILFAYPKFILKSEYLKIYKQYEK